MADTAPVSSEQPATQAQPEPSALEKVYSEYGIEDQAQSFQPASPQPQATPVAPIPKVPDPFAPEFGAYQAQLAQGVTVLSQALNQATGKLSALEKQIQTKAIESDIKSAVDFISSKSGIESEIAEVALEAQARKDPKFLQIWNNRAKNPKAYQAALAAVAGEFQSKFAVKQDPQLVENQRAVAASRNQMATTARQTENDRWAEMSASEREQERQRIRRLG